MAQISRDVFFYSVNLVFDYSNEIDLSEILLSTGLRNNFAQDEASGKCYEVRYVENYAPSGLVIGVIVATKTKNIPPKHRAGSSDYESVAIDRDEGLAYGNAFAYCPKLKVLALEANKNAANHSILAFSLSQILSAQHGFPNFQLNFFPLLSRIGYEKVLGLTKITEVAIKVANPVALFQRLSSEMYSPGNAARLIAENTNAEGSIELILKSSRAGIGLKGRNIIEFIQDILRAQAGNIGLLKKATVKGKTTDFQGKTHNAPIINLLHTYWLSSFKLESQRTQVDVQQNLRKNGIINAFEQCRSELESIL